MPAVRAATPADLDAVLALDDLEPATRRLLADDLAAADRRTVLVATADDDRVVGVVIAMRQQDAAHVLDVVVARDRRRRGIGARLLRALAVVAVRDDVPALTLEVRASNLAARALYEQLGFEDAGVRPGYYRDGEDAHVLWHHDPTALAAGPDVTGPRP